MSIIPFRLKNALRFYKSRVKGIILLPFTQIDWKDIWNGFINIVALITYILFAVISPITTLLITIPLNWKRIKSYEGERKEYIRLLYVRFGEIPKDEESQIYSDNIIIGNEEGVSVYEAIERKKRGRKEIQIIYPDLTYNSCVTMSGCIQREAWEVIGDKVGYGSDGEPLLQNVKVIRRLGFLNKFD